MNVQLYLTPIPFSGDEISDKTAVVIDVLRCTTCVSDAGSLALLLYRSNKTALRQTIAEGEHARFLVRLGFESDVTAAAACDTMPVLPILKDGCLVPADE